MGIHVGMLIFALFDGSLAFAIVFCLWKAKLKGKTAGRILGTICGTLVFSVYIALFVWFNTPGVNVNDDFKTLVYAAPIVLCLLLTALVLLCQPPKKAQNTEEPSGKPDTPESEGSEASRPSAAAGESS